MARFWIDVPMAKNMNQTFYEIQQFLLGEGFAPRVLNREECWQKGSGILTGPQFIKITQLQNYFRVEAWIKYALLPGVYIGEMGIEGFFGALPKSILKKRVFKILAIINPQQYSQYLPNPAPQQNYRYVMPQQHQPYPQNRNPVQNPNQQPVLQPPPVPQHPGQPANVNSQQHSWNNPKKDKKEQ